MTLPDVCPKDGSSQCKGSACHLYIVDWRSGDEQCIIGYRSTQKKITASSAVEDTYAETTRRRMQQKPRPENVERPPWPDHRASNPTNVRVVAEDPVYSKPLPSEPAAPLERPEQLQEKVVVKNKDTMVFESVAATDNHSREQKKRKSLDDVMNLDLPDDYEEEFWK